MSKMVAAGRRRMAVSRCRRPMRRKEGYFLACLVSLIIVVAQLASFSSIGVSAQHAEEAVDNSSSTKTSAEVDQIITTTITTTTATTRQEEDKQDAVARTPDFWTIINKASKKALNGGIPGAFAGLVQVLCLMWLRTVINYQCRYGKSFVQALSILLKQGGIRRLYDGVGFAILQAPMARFVSTASNDGIQTLLHNLQYTKEWGPGRTTFIAAIVVGFGRIVLMPIDTMKVVLQVDSTDGFRSLMKRLKSGHIAVLYQGSLATAFSAIVGHYPWFFTYNWLSTKQWIYTLFPSKVVRNGCIGLAASVVSDVIVNALRVIKTTKQSLGPKHYQTNTGGSGGVGYVDAIRIILAADGWKGLFGRGLRARIFANALQSILFTIIWRGLAEQWKYFRDNKSRRNYHHDDLNNSETTASTNTNMRGSRKRSESDANN